MQVSDSDRKLDAVLAQLQAALGQAKAAVAAGEIDNFADSIVSAYESVYGEKPKPLWYSDYELERVPAFLPDAELCVRGSNGLRRMFLCWRLAISFCRGLVRETVSC